MLITDPTSDKFNSYASLEDLEEFTTARGIELPVNGEPLMVKSMDYLNGLNWNGQRATRLQPLAWPRAGILFDGFPFPSDIIPRQLIIAQCMLAIESEREDLLTANREAPIKSERVEGAITTTWAIADGEVFKQSYPAVMAILNGFVIGDGFAINAVARRA